MTRIWDHKQSWVKINGTYVPQVLLSIKGITGIRVVEDSDSCPFSFHAMSSEGMELGYIIPNMGHDFYPIKREWGQDSKINSDWIPLSY